MDIRALITASASSQAGFIPPVEATVYGNRVLITREVPKNSVIMISSTTLLANMTDYFSIQIGVLRNNVFIPFITITTQTETIDADQVVTLTHNSFTILAGDIIAASLVGIGSPTGSPLINYYFPSSGA